MINFILFFLIQVIPKSVSTDPNLPSKVNRKKKEENQMNVSGLEKFPSISKAKE